MIADCGFENERKVKLQIRIPKSAIANPLGEWLTRPGLRAEPGAIWVGGLNEA